MTRCPTCEAPYDTEAEALACATDDRNRGFGRDLVAQIQARNPDITYEDIKAELGALLGL